MVPVIWQVPYDEGRGGTTSLGAFALLLPSRLSSLATSPRACSSTSRRACLPQYSPFCMPAPRSVVLRAGFGGLAQLLAGMWEARRGKMFGESSHRVETV